MSKAVVLLVDGLGAEALKARAGHARTLAAAFGPASRIGTVFPSTTAAALASLTTGERPGQHGIVGYSAFDPENDRVMNQLSGWDSAMDPETWQRASTAFQSASAQGIPSMVVASPKYAESGFTRAVLRGAEYIGADSITTRFTRTREVLEASDRALVYLYVPELDQIAHRHGWQSEEWLVALEELDSEVRTLSASLRPGEGLLVTADHGIVDVEQRNHVLFDRDPTLVDGVRHVAGEPRCLQLHFEPDASDSLKEKVIGRWRQAEESRSWVATRAEAVGAGWFGESVAPEVVPRIGDVLVAARKAVAYYDSRAASQSGRSMVGQHGSLSSEEMTVPLLRFGAFA